jgi:hypothetical protein
VRNILFGAFWWKRTSSSRLESVSKKLRMIETWLLIEESESPPPHADHVPLHLVGAQPRDGRVHGALPLEARDGPPLEEVQLLAVLGDRPL